MVAAYAQEVAHKCGSPLKLVTPGEAEDGRADVRVCNVGIDNDERCLAQHQGGGGVELVEATEPVALDGPLAA